MDGSELARKGLGVLVMIGGLFAAAFYGFRWLLADAVGDPWNDFLPLFGAMFLLLGLGSLGAARKKRHEGKVLSDGVSEPLDRSGRRAVAGIIEPVGELLTAPFSERKCVAYDYRIFTGVKSGQRSTYRLHYSGMHLTPSKIRSPQGDCHLFAFPHLEHLQEDDGDPAKGRDYVDQGSFENLGGGVSQLSLIGAAAEAYADDDGTVAKDWRLEPLRDLRQAKFKERIVAPGASVCAIGMYSEARRGLVLDEDEGGITLRMGSPDEVFADTRSEATAYVVFGILFLFAAAATLAPIVWDLPLG